jgi:hypothetical protein
VPVYATAIRRTFASRLARYALFSALHGLVAVTAALGAFGAAAGPVVLALSLPLVFAWGAFQADVAINPELDDTERRRWRIVLWCAPWSMTVYWLRHVRPRGAVD